MCFRFVVNNSVEELIMDQQEQKRASLITAQSSGTSAAGPSSVGREISDEEAASLRNWEKEEGEKAVMSQLLDKIVSPRKTRAQNHAQEQQGEESQENNGQELVIADPRDRRFGDDERGVD